MGRNAKRPDITVRGKMSVGFEKFKSFKSIFVVFCLKKKKN